MEQQLYRWVKASERLPQFENAPDDFGIVFRNLKQVKIFTVYPSYTKNITALLQNNLDNWEWLEEISENEQDELWNGVEDIFDNHTSPTGGGYEADYTYKNGFINECKSKYHLIKK